MRTIIILAMIFILSGCQTSRPKTHLPPSAPSKPNLPTNLPKPTLSKIEPDLPETPPATQEEKNYAAIVKSLNGLKTAIVERDKAIYDIHDLVMDNKIKVEAAQTRLAAVETDTHWAMFIAVIGAAIYAGWNLIPTSRKSSNIQPQGLPVVPELSPIVPSPTIVPAKSETPIVGVFETPTTAKIMASGVIFKDTKL